MGMCAPSGEAYKAGEAQPQRSAPPGSEGSNATPVGAGDTPSNKANGKKSGNNRTSDKNSTKAKAKPKAKPAAGAGGKLRNMPNKNQAFKRPVTGIDVVEDAPAGAGAGDAAAAKKAPKSKTPKSAAKSAAKPTAKPAAKTAAAAKSPSLLAQRTRKSPTRPRGNSSPVITKLSSTSSPPMRGRSATVAARPAKKTAVPAPRRTRSKTVAAPSKKQMLLQWCKGRIEPHAAKLDVKPGFPKNFSKAWKSGKAVCGLLHDADPSSVPLDKVMKMTPAERLEFAFSLAEKKYGVERILDVEDITDFPKPDDKCIMLYVSMLNKGLAKF